MTEEQELAQLRDNLLASLREVADFTPIEEELVRQARRGPMSNFETVEDRFIAGLQWEHYDRKVVLRDLEGRK